MMLFYILSLCIYIYSQVFTHISLMILRALAVQRLMSMTKQQTGYNLTSNS